MPTNLPINSNHRFQLPVYGGKKFYALHQIIRLESDSNYTYVHFSDRKPLLVAKVLREFENLLLPFGFIRTHRSHLVNKIHIVGLDASGSIAMTDESTAAVSRRKRKNVINEIAETIKAA